MYLTIDKTSYNHRIHLPNLLHPWQVDTQGYFEVEFSFF